MALKRALFAILVFMISFSALYGEFESNLDAGVYKPEKESYVEKGESNSIDSADTESKASFTELFDEQDSTQQPVEGSDSESETGRGDLGEEYAVEKVGTAGSRSERNNERREDDFDDKEIRNDRKEASKSHKVLPERSVFREFSGGERRESSEYIERQHDRRKSRCHWRHHDHWRHHGHRHERHHDGRRRHHRKCGKYGKFEESECLWPNSTGKPTLPEACVPRNITKWLPPVIAQYYEDKAKSIQELIQSIFKKRGLDKPCGYCSRKIACRQLVHPPHHRGRRPRCKKIDMRFVKEECEGTDPCQASLVDGACPAPFPQKKLYLHNLFVKRRRHIKSHVHFLDNHFNWQRDESYDDDEEDQRDAEKSTDSAVDEMDIAEDDGIRYSLYIPIWHCVKNGAGDKCWCCCGGYFPDAKTGKCVKVKHGNRYPPFESEELS